DDTFGRTPLSRAAKWNCVPVVKLLLEWNANIEAKDDKTGETPLSWAVMEGHELVVKLLREKQAAIDRARYQHSSQAATSPTQDFPREERLRPDSAPMRDGEWV
ncbi:hypothetical protein GX51_02438, partial [Blastomyces parvus]